MPSSTLDDVNQGVIITVQPAETIARAHANNVRIRENLRKQFPNCGNMSSKERMQMAVS